MDIRILLDNIDQEYPETSPPDTSANWPYNSWPYNNWQNWYQNLSAPSQRKHLDQHERIKTRRENNRGIVYDCLSGAVYETDTDGLVVVDALREGHCTQAIAAANDLDPVEVEIFVHRLCGLGLWSE